MSALLDPLTECKTMSKKTLHMTTNKNQKIRYSRGRDNYDNAPEQRTADNFDQFEW